MSALQIQQSLKVAPETEVATQPWVQRLRPKKAAVEVTPALIVLAAVVYGVLYFSMGNIWLPNHAAFCLILIWAAAILLAGLAQWLRVPRVVGMLGAGILLANVPGNLVAAFPPKWGIQMRAAALATIFLRCGLELEFKTMRLYKWPAVRLAFIPGIIEALYDAGIATAVFGMPYTLSLSLGFILKAVGPGLVVPAMFQLQKTGWGAVKGIPSTVVIAASFDDIIAITGFSIFINIAIGGSSSGDTAWQIASGPLQVVFGLLGGYLAGMILGATKLFNNKYKRLIGIYGAALLIMFFLEHFDMLSGGALGSLAVGLVTSWHWDSGRPAWASSGADPTYSYLIERVLAKVWDWVWEPLLFATIGTTIVFSKLGGGIVPKALLIVCTGLVVRVCATFIVMSGLHYSVKERLFYATAWSPKATVQASLSAVPLTMIIQQKSGDPDFETWRTWGQEMLTTGVFAIIICATLGTLMVFWLAPVLLEQQQVEGEGPSEANGAAPPPVSGVARDDSVQLSRASRAASPAKALSLSLGLGNISKRTSALLDGEPGVEAEDIFSEEEGARRWHGGPMAEEFLDAVDDLVVVLRGSRGSLDPEASSLLTRVDYLGQVLHSRMAREQTVRQMLRASALRHSASFGVAHDEMVDNLVRLSLTVQGAAEAGHAVPPATAQALAQTVAGIQATLGTAGRGAGPSSSSEGPNAQQQQQRAGEAQGGDSVEAARTQQPGGTQGATRGVTSPFASAGGAAADLEAQLPPGVFSGASASTAPGNSLRSRHPTAGANQ